MRSTSDSPNANMLFDIMLSHNLARIVQQPTHVGDAPSTLLDLAFMHRYIFYSCVWVEPGLWDHNMLAVSFYFHCNRSNSPYNSKQVKNISRANNTSIQEYLEFKLVNFDGDDAVTKFKNLRFHCIELVVPNKTKKPPKCQEILFLSNCQSLSKKTLKNSGIL